MARAGRWLVLLASVGFAGIQFIPMNRANPPVTADFDGPSEVRQIFRRSCYDCHSNETAWPWYSHVAPVSWLAVDHVKQGRKELNFSKWGTLTDRRRNSAREDILDQVESGEMPRRDYLLMHPSAKISKADLEALRAWAEEE